MNYIREEREINIGEFIYSIVSKWRIIMAWVIAVMIIDIVINLINGIEYIELLGMAVIVKTMIKYAIIIGVVTGVLAVVYYSVRFFFTDVVKSSKELKYVVSIDLLGCIPKIKKNKECVIDRVLKKICGFKSVSKSKEEYVEHFVKTLETEIAVKKQTGDVRIAVITSDVYDTAQEIVDLSKDKIAKNVTLVCAGDIMTSATAVEEAAKADYVILVERCGKSKYNEIEEECKKVSAWQKEIMGIVVIDAE